MASRNRADVVFCVDASGSMRPCLDGVVAHVGRFVDGLQSAQQAAWDVRLDFVAYSAGIPGDGADTLLVHRSVRSDDLWTSLYGQGGGDALFTSDPAEFKNALSRVRPDGDEATLVALDFALDFPWRPAAEGHRVVVLLTDEPVARNAVADLQRSRLVALKEKVSQLGVRLFIVAPDCDVLAELSGVRRAVYEVVDQGDGLVSVDFAELLAQMGKTVSSAQAGQQAAPPAPVVFGLFGQPDWRTTAGGSFVGR